MIDMDKDFILSSAKGRANKRYIKKNYPTEYVKILTFPGKSFSEQLYNYFNNCPQHTCPTCGNITPFRNILHGYSMYCSAKCSYKSLLRTQKSKQTCLERYGVENPSQAESVKKKKEETCLKNFGVNNSLKINYVRELSKKKLTEKYGTHYVFLNEDIQKKALEVKRKKFMGTHELHIGYTENGEWICKCPHKECNKCNDKIFYIPQQIFNDRMRNNSELCTKLLPVGKQNQKTTIELFVHNILNKYNIEYKTNIRNIINPKEIDIFIPGKNIAIECNGIYWHSMKPSNYHINKFTTCQKLNIQLITIWEDWVKTKPEIVKSVILSKLGIYKERIYARDCIIRKVDSKTCNDFLEKNHIQGRSQASFKFGLYFKGRLVSIMTFSKSRLGIGKPKDEYSYELVRFCNKLNTQIIGGASKLFKYFLKHYNPTKIYSYSSNDISNGGLYEKLGFKHNIKISQAYWYIDQNTFQRYHRFNFRKVKLKEMGFDIKNKTEYEIMKKLPYWRIYDSGVTRWEFGN